jgi:quercetin dioxygenase-like cupin family protein
VHLDDLSAEVWDDPTRGRLAFTTLFSSDLTPTDTFTAGLAEVPAGGWLGRHRHNPAELYYVVAGQGILALDGVEQEVRAGSAIYVPGDVEHGISNIGIGLLRFFYTFAVAGFAEVEYRFS